MTTLKKGSRVTGPERAKLVKAWGKLYERGASIRDIASSQGTSIGRVGNYVRESGVQLRSRGGAQRKPGRAKQPTAKG